MAIWQITDWLYKGNITAVADQEYAPLGINGIINLCENNERAFPWYPRPYLWQPFSDAGEHLTLDALRLIARFYGIHRRTLVHCVGGRNRSSAVCAYLLVFCDGLTPAKASELVKIAGNAGVRGELIEWFKLNCSMDFEPLRDS